MSVAPLAPVNASALLPNREITKQQLKEVHATIADYLNNAGVRDGICKELETMGKSVRGLEANFEKVSGCFINLDDLGVVRGQDGQVIKFAPEWGLLHNEYTSLVKKSRETATIQSKKITELLEVLMPYVASNHAPVTKKEYRLNEYIAELEEFAKSGTAGADRFLKLRENVVAFQKKLHGIFPSQIADVKETLEKLDVEIQKVETELGELSEFLGKTWYHAAGDTDGLSGLVNLAPKATFPILAKLLSLFGESNVEKTLAKANEKEKKETQLKELKKKQGDLNIKRAHLEATLIELNALDATFADLIGRLTTMETIWKMLANDSTKLKEGMVKVYRSAPKRNTVGDEDEAFFLHFHMKSLKAVYLTLRDALETYARSVVLA